MSIPKVYVEDIIVWEKSTFVETTQDEEEKIKTPFPVRKDLNSRVAIWRGSIFLLEVDAIVAPSNESLLERSGVTGEIYNHASPELQLEVSRLEGCRTGDAKATGSHGLPCRYIFHTVGPRYSPKYEIAAQNALHSCYRNCLTLAKEKGLTTIAFPIVHSEKRGFPRETGISIALKTVRRFMEHFPETFEKIIFCLGNNADYEIYYSYFSDYFPRNSNEVQQSLARIPEEIGNEWGELELDERKIRISSFPGSEDKEEQNSDEESDDDEGDEKVLAFDPKILTPMQDDLDTQRQNALAQRSNKQIEAEKTEYMYNYYLDQARKTNLSDIAQLNIVYRSGEDSKGRPLIILVGKNLDKADPSRVTLYMVDVLQRVLSKQDAQILYFHTCIESTPQLSWLKEIYSILEVKFRQHLKGFLMIHPTFGLRVAMGFLKIFLDEDFMQKVRFISSLNELYQVVDPRNMKLPTFIYRFDSANNKTGNTFEPDPLDGEAL